VSEHEGGASAIDVVFLDVGGVIYDDTVYRQALLLALRDLGASVADDAFDREYERCRDLQGGSFRRRLAAAFLSDGTVDERTEALRRRASRYWSYTPGALEADVLPVLGILKRRYRLGIIANQPSDVRAALRRDGIDAFLDVWGISDDLGLEKPDQALYAQALRLAGVEPGRAVMVGDRLDYDVRPARAQGMRAIWVLRGEAPRRPTAEQLSEADASIHSLSELPAVLESL
jgi:HAD superfamily hydrolase (TIGR01549 family)